jgi:hypothetical protein
VKKSKAAGRTWIVSSDEQAPASVGVVADSVDPNHDTIRKNALWGNIMAGGAGVEYYFGRFAACKLCLVSLSVIQHTNLSVWLPAGSDDNKCEDFRSRANMWVQSKHAVDFFSNYKIPFQNMSNNNTRVSPGNWCLEGRDDNQEPVLVVYLYNSTSTSTVDLRNVGSSTTNYISGHWYDPRNGGGLQSGPLLQLLQLGQGPLPLGNPPGSVGRDWVVLLAGSG